MLSPLHQFLNLHVVLSLVSLLSLYPSVFLLCVSFYFGVLPLLMSFIIDPIRFPHGRALRCSFSLSDGWFYHHLLPSMSTIELGLECQEEEQDAVITDEVVARTVELMHEWLDAHELRTLAVPVTDIMAHFEELGAIDKLSVLPHWCPEPTVIPAIRCASYFDYCLWPQTTNLDHSLLKTFFRLSKYEHGLLLRFPNPWVPHHLFG